MKKIKFMLEYQSIPIWLYNSKNEMVGAGVPNELLNNQEFISLINEIQQEYDNLFEDNEVNFEYHGFKNEVQKKIFFDKVYIVINLLKRELNNKYIIQIDVEPTDF